MGTLQMRQQKYPDYVDPLHGVADEMVRRRIVGKTTPRRPR